MKNIIVSIVLMLCIPAFGQEKDTLKVDTMAEKELSAVTVSVRKLGVRRMGGAENGVIIGREEIGRAHV